MEISSCSVEESESDSTAVAVFEIPRSELDAFYQREQEFRFVDVLPHHPDHQPMENTGILCAGWADDATFFQEKGIESMAALGDHWTKWELDQIWRDDVYPCRLYLKHCLLAAKNLGLNVYNNFLDHSYLADRTTTLRSYLESMENNIFAEISPPELAERYNG
eukprot:TRINITY_DN5764_c0_g2_i5.p2 TRINITY_DN5764_c0_g2~~TRINITY_DN5764_c0_g2_i5.p2  ORF type:complete len:163 (+),score=30.04 TRINITY_DN5764_c0_g2_i5:284-772(+)